MLMRYPFVELVGYRHFRELQRRIIYSPVAILLVLVGLAGAVYGLGNFWRRGLAAFPQDFLLGTGIFIGSYVLLMTYYYGFRFRYLKCPDCSGAMQPFLADQEDGTWRRFMLAFEIGGKYYRRPRDSDDPRPWVRLMRYVRACPRCRTFVDCSYIHEQACTPEELEQLQQRVP
jgi:hypothetical protein